MTNWKTSKKGVKGGKKVEVKEYKKCHEGNIFVLQIGNVKVFGGGSSRGYKPFQVDILVDTLGTFTNESLPSRTEYLFPTLASLWPIVLPLEITNGCAPSWVKLEWEAFILDLENIKEEKDLLVFCVGGHGRTGTILSILVGLVHPERGDPVKWIRDNYCEQAVESKKQIEYVEKITDIEVKEEARPFYTKTTHYGGAYSSGGTPPLFSTILPDDPSYKEDGWKESVQNPGYEYRYLNKKAEYRLPPEELDDDPEYNWISEYSNTGEWEDSKYFDGWEVNLSAHAYRRKNGNAVVAQKGSTTVVQPQKKGGPPRDRVLRHPITWSKDDWITDPDFPGWLYSKTLGMWKRSN